MMKVDRRARLAGALALCAAFAGPLAARDVYRGFLDPGNPQHRATLDLLERLEKTPNDASLHNDLACLIARDGFWRDALREFGVAAKLDKADGRPLFNAGLVHAMRGEWRSAASSFRKAVSRTPGNWAGWWMLGFAEEQRGNESAAVAAYKTSLRVDTSLFDVRKNPYAARTRLKGRVLLETLDSRSVRLALPATEQMAEPDLVTSFQQGRVAVAAIPGAPVPAGAPAPGVPVPDDRASRPGPVGPVVTSVPPVSASRPAPPPGSSVSAPVATPLPVPTVTRANEPIPSGFPEQSPAGPAPPRRVHPTPRDGEDSPTPVPTPTPRPAGPGIG
ncbi:MAG TPA: hypothetical protein VKS23_08105 [Thermoanaerobaculia bacterium]|nr:hypothetical protein [Thermoanaerobaculia bacterium]